MEIPGLRSSCSTPAISVPAFDVCMGTPNIRGDESRPLISLLAIRRLTSNAVRLDCVLANIGNLRESSPPRGPPRRGREHLVNRCASGCALWIHQIYHAAVHSDRVFGPDTFQRYTLPTSRSRESSERARRPRALQRPKPVISLWYPVGRRR